VQGPPRARAAGAAADPDPGLLPTRGRRTLGPPSRPAVVVAGGAGMLGDPVLALVVRLLVLLVVLVLLAAIVRNTRRR
jgi:hypothetical protein